MTRPKQQRDVIGDLIALGETALQSPDAVGRLMDGVESVANSLREIAQSRVEQSRIRAQADVEIAGIHAARDVLLQYLDRSFDERRRNFDALFGALDRALADGQLESAARTLDAVVALAASSPFKDLADVSKAHKMLKDKSHDWKF